MPQPRTTCAVFPWVADPRRENEDTKTSWPENVQYKCGSMFFLGEMRIPILPNNQDKRGSTEEYGSAFVLDILAGSFGSSFFP
ncbi:hypothetical protein BaRGS_00021613 [Batillaria attramentaria]|uniref:Uncharacterized protein n=1 Tax=Batillaria attramentaria TaxID=370345 RepID=A0ABD0KIS4_9CAEN